jgi:hypothetical protein
VLAHQGREPLDEARVALLVLAEPGVAGLAHEPLLLLEVDERVLAQEGEGFRHGSRIAAVEGGLEPGHPREELAVLGVDRRHADGEAVVPVERHDPLPARTLEQARQRGNRRARGMGSLPGAALSHPSASARYDLAPRTSSSID